MHLKSNLEKHRLSFVLSWAWALAGFVLFALIVERIFNPIFFLQFGDDPTPVNPLFWGSCLCYFLVAWLMISERRLPYANNMEVLVSTSFILACLLLLFLAATREFYSGTYLVTFLCFEVLWFGLEVLFRGRFVKYRFAIFPASVELSPRDFHEHGVCMLERSTEVSTAEFDAAIVDFNVELDDEWRTRLADCQNSGIPIIPLSTFLENTWGRIPIEMTKTSMVFNVGAFRPYQIVKPLVERVAAALGLVLVSPVLLAAALLVKTTSKGPILFRQERIGLNGRPFIIYKLRTMLDGMDKLGVFAATEDDARFTSIGGFLRKYHIDELPQLFNVVKGDMSIVGPRPEASETSTLYNQVIPGYSLRHAMRPGVTSWALIHQGNVAGIEDAKVKLSYDLYYIKHASCFLDFYIVMKTLWVMIIGIETLSDPAALKVFGRKTR